MPEESTKQCTKCSEVKSISEFHKCKGGKYGVNSVCKSCQSAYGRKWREAKGKSGKRDYHYQARYGITLDQYDDMLSGQNHQCKLCGSPDPRRKSGFVVDHDHTNGKIRGLLCHPCNLALGILGDNIVGLTRAVHYLEKKWLNLKHCGYHNFIHNLTVRLAVRLKDRALALHVLWH